MNRSTIVQLLFVVFALTSATWAFSQPVFSISNKKDACNGLQNGSFDITVSSASGTVSAFVFNAGHSPNPIGPVSLTVGVPSSVTGLVGTAAGNSTLVVVSDDNGSSSSSVTIFLRSNVSVSLVSKTDVTTCSPYNGAISINASGGSSSYTFSWTGPSGFTDPGTQNLSAIGPGDYTVTVNDANTACSASLGPITINIASPSITLGSIPGVCSGTTSSTLPYSATTGSPNQYTIDWDNTANSAGLADVAYTALPASPIPISGIPSVAVTTTFNGTLTAKNTTTGCVTAANSISVTVTNITFTTAKTDVTCNGNNNGTITVTAAGGSSYSYSKDNGTSFQASNVFTSLAPATYQIVVKDVSGCLSTASSVTISQPSAVTFTDVKTDVTGCFGNTNGSIVVTASGGSGSGYTYSKDNGTTFQASNTFSSLGAGTYQIVVKDGSGCLSSATSVTINQPTAVTFTDVKTDVTCNGGSDGSIVVTASGGNGSYTYSKNNGSTFQASNTFSGLTAATYQIVVKDGNGCLSAATAVTISAPVAVTFTTSKTNVTCNGGSDGSITVTASGGNGTYTYSKDNGGTFQASNIFSSLTAATYQIKVKDGNGCVSLASAVTLSQPAAVTFTDVKTDVTGCFGNTNGSIVVTASGGSGSGYTYSKDNGTTFQASNTFSGLAAATYQVMVKDGNGCSSSATSVTINQPTAVTFSTVKTNATCNGGSDGTITVTASGGSGSGYTYSKDNGSTFQASNVFNGLSAATYQIVVKDGNGCSSSATSVTITAPTAVTFTTAKTDVTCNGSSDGTITVTASGGSGAGYTYSKDNGATFQASNVFNSLAVATYQIVVKDGNGCLSSATGVTIGQPAVVTFTNTKTDATCNGVSNGTITVTASGGSGTGYTYSKDNGTTFQASNSFTGLAAATYQIVVKDGNGCLSSATSVTIGQPAAVTFTNTKTDASCNGASDGTITVTASGGSGSGYTYSKDNGTTFQASNVFSALPAATYQIVVKDGNGCLSSPTSVTINQPSAVTFTDVKTDVTCNGGSNGTITVTASGGSGSGYTYSKDNGATFQASNVFSGLAAATYQIVVKDGNSCSSSATAVTISAPAVVTFTDVKTDVTCNGNADGTITVTAAGGSGAGYSYSKDNGTTFQASNVFNALAPATYQIVVKDGNGCLSSATGVTISQPAAVTFTDVKTDVTGCAGNSNGSIVVTASGGSGAGYTYSKDNGTTFQASNTFSGLTAATYQVVVKDGNGCSSAASGVTINQPTAVTFTSAKTDATCNGGSDGTITVTASGGSGAGYTYSKDNGTTFQAGNVFSGLAAATYQVVVKDGNGCVSSATGVTIGQPSVVTFTDVKTDVTCNGGTNGKIQVNASGGSGAGYSYSDDNGVTFQPSKNFNNLAAGTYQIVVKDGNGCLSAASSVTINQPTAVSFTQTSVDVTCNGGSTGSITVTASGGSGSGYTYSKDNGTTFQVSNVFNGLVAGTYNIVVKDGNGCSTVATPVTINQPTAVTFTNTSTNVTCNGGNNGSITVTASGGNGTYTYSSDNGTTYQASNTISGLTANTYNVIVKDGTGCLSAATPVTITQPAAITFTASKTDVTTCTPGNDGSITVSSAAGGSGSGYTYSIDNGTTYQAGTTFSGLTAGSYNVVVKDGAGCVSAATVVTVGSPGGLSITTAQTNVSCNGGIDGSITIAASGGSGTYTYSKDNGSTFTGSGSPFTFNSLAAGTYQLVVKDGNNCQFSSSVTITEPTVLSLTTSQTDATCNAASDGSITITASGGTSPYQYSKDNGTTFQASNVFSGLIAGVYNIVVKDGNGCSTAATPVTINQPTAVTFTNTSTNVTCNGGNNGSITVTASGGNGTYTYSSDNGTTYQASNIFSGLTANTYNMIVKDGTGCLSAATPVTITQPAAITFTASKTDVTTCTPGNDGSITVSSAAGGSGSGYTYSIDNGTTYQAGTTFSGLTAGSYNVVVKDGAGCVSAATAVTVGSPGGLSITTAQTNVSCNGGSNGSITITASGGSGTYTYSKDNGATFIGSGSPFTFNSLAAGTYQLVVKDGNGCQFSTSITITEPAVLTSSYGYPVSVSCHGGSNGSIGFGPTGGTAPYQYSIDGGATYVSTNPITGLSAGTYSAVVKDANACLTSPFTITIADPTPITFTTSKVDASSCVANDGQIAVTASGGLGSYQYSIDNGATFQASNVFLNLSPGSYQVVVTDAGNCTTPATAVTISSPGGLTFSSSKTDVTCAGNSDGTITITVSGGTAPYQYSDDNGTTFQASNVFNSLAVGTYQLVAKDASGCQFSASVSIGQPTAVTFTFTKVDAGCSGSTGSITITGSGGNNLYTYSIDNGTTYQASNTFGNLAAQTYQAVIKDGNNCTSPMSTVTINAGNLTVNSSKSDATCAGNDGSITVSSVTGGTSPYQYSIDGGTTYQASNLFTNLNVGSYSLMVKDNTGCTSSVTSISISKPGSCVANCGAFTIGVTDTRPTCSGKDDGTITLTVSGGSPNYVVTLSDASQSFNQALVGPGPSFQFINLSPSLSYQYTVTDQAGNICTQPYSLPIQTNVQATASNFVNAMCYNQAVGQATVTVTSGGTSPYEYSLDAGATWVSFTSPVVITNLKPAPAPYSILVRDDPSDLCPAQVSVTISNAVADIQITSTTTDATCANDDGAISITSISGGTGPYTYLFDGVSQTGLTYTGLSGGSHTFTVTDANSCTKTFPFTVNFPGLVKFSAVVHNPDCSGAGNNGSIIVTIKSSGTFDVGITTDPTTDPTVYQNIVSAGSSTATFPGLSQGSYTVVAKPAGALCKSDTLVLISGGPYAVDFNFKTSNFVCYDGNKGVAKLYDIKGSPSVVYNYEIFRNDSIPSYLYNSGTISQIQAADTVSINGLKNGSYQIHLYQRQPACPDSISSAAKSFSIVGPTVSSFDTLVVQRTPSEYNLATGSMRIDIQNIYQPTYHLKLHLETPAIVGQTNKHNGFDSLWVLANVQVNQLIEYKATDLFAGVYKLTIRDTLGCTKNYELTIPLDTKIYIPNFFTPNNDGKNDEFKILYLPENSHIIISNRWGKEVFSASKFSKEADGITSVIWNGGAESDGIYFYTLNTPGKTYTGWVEIQR